MSARGASSRSPARWPANTFLSRLPDDAADALLRLGNPVTFEPGGLLLRQGDVGTHVFLLRAARAGGCACVKITAAPENGSETLLAIRVSGDIVGEMGVLREATRGATVKACTDVVAQRISRSDFLTFLDRCPDGWRAVGATIADRLDWANRRRTDIAGYDVATRLARVILEVADRHGQQTGDGWALGVQLSQPEWGSLVGASTAAARKAFQKLREADVIKIRYRRITVTNMRVLKIVAGFGEDNTRAL